MVTNEIQFLDCYLPLIEPNHSPAECKKFDSLEYRADLIRRMLAGEQINPAEFGARTIIGESGRSTGKTTHTEFAIAKAMTDYSERGDSWYCRSELGDIRNSVFTSMQSTLYSLGFTLSNNHKTSDFYVSVSPFEIVNNRSGDKIQFLPINKDINRTKGFVAPSKRLKYIVVEEANEVDDGKFITALETTANKFITSKSKFVYNLNPPETRQHWSVEYFKQKEREGATRIYTTWKYLTENGLLSPATIADILKMEKSNPLFYRYWYLGEIVKLTGLVFPMFDRDKHIVHIRDNNRFADLVAQIIFAGDAANKNDATAMAMMCILRNGDIIVPEAFYYDPLVYGQTDDVDLAQKICDWYGSVMNKYSGLQNKRQAGTIDNANWNLLQMLQKSNAMGWFKWYPATNKMILRDTNRLRVLLRNKVLRFVLKEGNGVQAFVDEIENYVYDEKSGEIKKNQRDHGIDALKYGTLLYENTQIFF